jgi:hypothetical protein
MAARSAEASQQALRGAFAGFDGAVEEADVGDRARSRPTRTRGDAIRRTSPR